MNVYSTADVFVAGGAPTITYNPRDERKLERGVRDYLAQRGKALTVSGPTKSGKSVLVERILPPSSAVWVYGPDLVSVDSFWSAVANGLQAFETIEHSSEEGAESAGRFGGSLGIPGVGGVEAGGEGAHRESTTRTMARKRSASDAVRETLARKPKPIVIDDFHYIDGNVKRAITRGIKTIIPTSPVVMIAVPHEAFDAVRHEPDMDGRVWHLPIQHWSNAELEFIANSGFEALNLEDVNGEIAHPLAEASYGAPFLMQQLCFDLVTEFGVTETVPDRLALDAKEILDWQLFFEGIADRSTPGVFQKLLSGPDPRGQQRIDRTFRADRRTTDIYGAVLYSIGEAGRRTGIPLQTITKILQEQLEEAPSSQQIAGTLNQMKDIAFKNRGASDPALDFKDGQVHVLDPFLAFYLRYGSWMPAARGV